MKYFAHKQVEKKRGFSIKSVFGVLRNSIVFGLKVEKNYFYKSNYVGASYTNTICQILNGTHVK